MRLPGTAMPTDLADPIAFALLVARAMARAGVPCALYGGLALGVYGRARLTADADFAVAAADAGQLVAALTVAGLHAHATYAGLPHGGLLISRATVAGAGGYVGSNVVDAVAPRDAQYGAAVVERALPTQLRGEPIAVVAPEDFVVLKALSDRDVDIEDAASVMARLGAQLDRGRVELTLRSLAKSAKPVAALRRWRRMEARAASWR